MSDKAISMIHFWAKTTSEGKPGISVYDHMVNVGCVARCIAETSPEILDRFQLRSSVVGTLAALHDLGKISPGFQRKCKAWLEENGLTKIAGNGCWDTGMESDHGKVSHAAIQTFLVEKGIDRKTAKFVSTVLGAHHGRLTPPSDRGYRPQKAISETCSSIDWDPGRKANAQKIWGRFTESNTSFTFSDTSASLWWLAGLTSVADWIGSDERFFSSENNEHPVNNEVAALQALDTIGFRQIEFIRNLSFHDLFHDAEKPEILWVSNEMQEKTLAVINGPGVYVIEAPMGMGKTEAALWAAYQILVSGKGTGIYFALPTQATSNRMHLRMNEFVRRISRASNASRLIHGNAWLMDQTAGLLPAATSPGSVSEDARSGRDWFASAKRALLAPFGVGTVDQALLGVVAAKHFFVRHFALAGKVVILDEVHSYDLYTGTLIDKLITTLEGLGCTVVVLSATLSGKRRGQIVSHPDDNSNKAELPYPLITGRHEGNPLEPAAAAPPTSRTIKVDFITAEDAAKEAINLAQNGGAVLWICNTVDSAQKQYQRFTGLTQEDFPVGLLHSRFPFWRREEIEAEWMTRFGKNGATRCGSILVSTQIVEQSVDLDADLLITELAPTDMLLQRLGRLWRHNRKDDDRPVDTARLCIVKEKNSLEDFRNMEPKAIIDALGGKAHVYDPFVLLRSLDVWHGQNEVNIPAQIRMLIELTYEDRDNEPESWLKLYDDAYGQALAHRQRALMSSNIWSVALSDAEGVQTRLNEMPTVVLVLCRSLSDHKATFIDQSRGCLGSDQYRLPTAQAIHKNLVKIPRYHFDCIELCSAFTDYLYGEQSIGIVAESGAVEVKGLKDGTLLFYSDELGLIIKKSS
ncbi:MAG: CRISPR-associated helicase Cas3' [Deltaproteobacteria bacterium]|uniref:CRISPR-associated helicase Cas3 n=1 Tax=Candidatus Desulfacyla euxinica TaxID=2841693 RepID=A0A8J6T4I1_9DELT|nr:CRISPR-associated helicase Cas3' [Candidatus Desulfacyla euxinica]MBL7216363.1 CRISPR-associated helicase Cas3' [Desulfobacteraceae bacterium]